MSYFSDRMTDQMSESARCAISQNIELLDFLRAALKAWGYEYDRMRERAHRETLEAWERLDPTGMYVKRS